MPKALRQYLGRKNTGKTTSASSREVALKGAQVLSIVLFRGQTNTSPGPCLPRLTLELPQAPPSRSTKCETGPESTLNEYSGTLCYTISTLTRMGLSGVFLRSMT